MKRYLLAVAGFGLLAFVVFNFTIPPYTPRDKRVPAVICATESPLDGCISLLEASSEAAPEQPVVYINGIQNDYAAHQAALQNIQTAFHGAAITGIYNATVDIGHDLWQAMWDVVQCLSFLDFSDNPAVLSLRDQAHVYNGDLTLVGHSQGAAIISAALCDLQREDSDFDFSHLVIYTLGGAGVIFVDGPEYHHCIRASDPVGIAHLAKLVAQRIASMISPQAYVWEAKVTVLPPAPNVTGAEFLPATFNPNLIDFVLRQHDLRRYLDECMAATADNASIH